MGETDDRAELLRLNPPLGAHVTCAPLYFSGAWDAVVAPVAMFFGQPELRRRSPVLVYGPSHLFRSAWLAGAVDYLREPWTVEELFLRLRGPRPPFLEWQWAGVPLTLDGLVLSTDQGSRVRLSATEADLLRTLVLRRGLAVSRSVLGWAAGCSEGRVVDTLVGRIRGKVQALTGADDDPVPGVRGVGYRLP